MEDVTMNAIQMFTSYGSLGVIAGYFMYKDMTLNKQLQETLKEFSIAMETFFKVCKEGNMIAK